MSSNLINFNFKKKEKVISLGINEFNSVCNSLIDTRDNKLYLKTHSTFNQYLLDKFNISEDEVNNIIGVNKNDK